MWNDLSMKDKAAFIKVGVKNGLYSIDNIKAVYNKFSEGRFLDKGDDEKFYASHSELRGRLRTYPPKPNKEDVKKSDVVVVIN